MWDKCSRSISLFLFIVIAVSCRTTLKSLSSDKIPPEVGQHFSVIAFDSTGSLKPTPFRYETDTYISIFTMDASLVNDKVKGKLREKKIPKDLPDLPVKEAEQKPLALALKYKICCSNHNPNDCVNSKSEASDSAGTKKCSGWKLIVL